MSSQETVLSNLDGFEFEEMMMDVFRNLGYENIRNPGKTGDEGRDIIMEKEVNGERTTFIVECKNLSSHVGRPVVQKLHSAVSTFETDYEKRGMVVTTNKFSKAAKDYAEKLNIDLWDGRKIRQIADSVGLNLYNGEIEIVCENTLPVPEKRETVEKKVVSEFNDLRNFDRDVIDNIEVDLELVPALLIETEINSIYETTVGVVNKINEKETLIWRGDVEGKVQERRDQEVEELIDDSVTYVGLDKQNFSDEFDNIDRVHFEKTETGFKEDVIQHEISRHTEEVSYTGGNNVTYNKTHKPKKKDIGVNDITPIYVPKIKSRTQIKEHTHDYYFLTDNNLEVEKKNEVCKDTNTGRTPLIFSLTLCQYCGSINNRLNIRKERLENQPICRHCAQTERFMLRKKYFSNEQNLDEFKQKYREMPIQSRLMENKTGLLALSVILTYLVLTI